MMTSAHTRADTGGERGARDVGQLDLLPTDIEDSLGKTVRDLVRDRTDHPESVYDGERTSADRLWQSLAQEVGLAGLLVPEELGGAGATAREAAVVLAELGRGAAAVPFLTSSVIATTVLERALRSPESSEDDLRRLLEQIAAGTLRVAVAQNWAASTWEPCAVGDPDHLTGEIRAVADAVDSDVLLVPVGEGAGASLHAVQREDAEVVAQPSLDMTRPLAYVRLTNAPARLLVSGPAAVDAVVGALTVGAALMASEQVGVAMWCLETTVAHLKDRRQFGRVVGGFQALKHRLADMHIAIEGAKAAARYAAVTLAEKTDDASVAAHVAAAACGPVAVDAAEECLQLHGGIGMTWEHEAHLRLKRAVSDELGLGTATVHRARLADLVDLSSC